MAEEVTDMEKESQPYTYLLIWPDYNKYYYGVRFARGCNPNDLWITYFTSSKHVKKFVEIYGDPAIKQIRKIFEDKDAAITWENTVLRRLHVTKHEHWLNRTDNKALQPQYGKNNPATRPDISEKISIGVKKVVKKGNEHPMRRDPELAKTIGQKNKGRTNTWCLGDLNPAKRIEVRKILKEKSNGENNGFYGKEHSNEQKQKWSVARKGIPKPKVICPHCNKEGGLTGMSKWHFDKCKFKNN